MEVSHVQSLYEIVRAIAIAGDTRRVRQLLEAYEAGELTFEELVAEMRALAQAVH